MSKKDAYDAVTERIIEALEQGIVPWHRPWKSIGGGMTSLATGKPYQGVNVFILEATAALRGYSSRHWGTFKQIQDRGGKVRKGETGTAIVFWKFIEKTNKDTGKEERTPFLRYFTVFNTDQADNLEMPADEPLPAFDPIESAEAIQAGMPNRPNVKHGGDRAYYSPGLDYVQMPLTVAFTSPEGYYGTLFHELAHSTGHSSRLARKELTSPSPFGTPDYSKEELVAEMASAFLCGQAGIPVNVPQNAAYIASWLAVLKNDRKMIVSAAGQASKAANYILNHDPTKEESETAAAPVAAAPAPEPTPTLEPLALFA